jgi:hypothetical protein
MHRSSRTMAVLAVLLAACTPLTDPGDVEIRVANRSSRDFDRVVVNFYADPVDYGEVPAGAVSAYRLAKGAYRYAYVEVRMDTARLVLQPIDFVGETPLVSGRYTYALSVSPDRSLALTLERD